MGFNNTIRENRLRVNRTDTLNIGTSWTTVNFNGVSDLNVNTFGTDPVSGIK